MFYITGAQFCLFQVSSPSFALCTPPPFPSVVFLIQVLLYDARWVKSSQITFYMNQWIKTQWINFARWPRIIEMWAKSLNKWESSDKINNNASRLFKAIRDKSVTKLCMDKSPSKSSIHYLLSVEMTEEWWVTQCYICVWGRAFLLRSWEINSAYGLTVQSGRV